MGTTTLVLGGARSGKSRMAERLAAEGPPVIYVATATVDPTDPEMLARVARHRRDRPADWSTQEVSRNLADALGLLTEREGSVLIDCVTLWVSNLMLGLGGGPELDDEAILEAVGQAARVGRSGRARVIWVSNEVGSGGVAANALARRFNDLQGLVNQRLAAECDTVYFCVAGLPLRLK